MSFKSIRFWLQPRCGCQFLHLYAYLAVLVIVHRDWSWVELCGSLLRPLTACIWLSGIMEARSQDRGFRTIQLLSVSLCPQCVLSAASSIYNLSNLGSRLHYPDQPLQRRSFVLGTRVFVSLWFFKGSIVQVGSLCLRFVCVCMHLHVLSIILGRHKRWLLVAWCSPVPHLSFIDLSFSPCYCFLPLVACVWCLCLCPCPCPHLCGPLDFIGF